MTIAITADPIMAISDVKSILSEADDLETILMINAVSAKFLRFTHRNRINSGSVVEWAYGDGTDKIYLHAVPIDDTEEITLETYSGATVASTLTRTASELRAVNSAVDGYIVVVDTVTTVSESVANLKISFTGGWASGAIPGDIIHAAIEQMRIERNRREGNLGVVSSSRDGESVRFETSGLIKSVREAWEPYRIEV